jgi:hypothetical protein
MITQDDIQQVLLWVARVSLDYWLLFTVSVFVCLS